MNEADISFLLAIHRTLGLTQKRFLALNAFFEGNWKKLWTAKLPDLVAAQIDKRGIERFFSTREKTSPAEELDLLKGCGANVLTLASANYPLPLKNIYNAPAILFFRGEILNSDFPNIAVVGSRKLSAYGAKALEKVITEAAVATPTIVSGLAIGGDTVAHKSAIKNGCRTLAILGNGIDDIYPKQNYRFAEEILKKKQGAVISEYLPRTPIVPEYFVQRNRIISGLCKSLVVGEASEKSGTLITASLAIEQGKNMFSIPGDIFSPFSIGTNKLLASGQASALIHGNQLLRSLGIEPSQIGLKKKKKDFILTPDERIILEFLQKNGATEFNDLSEGTAITTAELGSKLSLLEIKGVLVGEGGKYRSF